MKFSLNIFLLLFTLSASAATITVPVPDNPDINFRDAIQGAINSMNPGDILTFDGSEYYVSTPFGSSDYSALAVDRNANGVLLHGITIDGNGANFQCGNWKTFLNFGNVENVTVKNLTISWRDDALPFSYGTITGEGPTQDNTIHYYDFVPANGTVARSGLSVKVVHHYDINNQRPGRGIYQRRNPLPHLSEILQDGVTMRIFVRETDDEFANFGVGTSIIAKHKVYGANALSFYDTDGITIDNITVYSAPGMGIRTNRCSNITVTNFDVRKKEIEPGTGVFHWLSVCADVHFDTTYGTLDIADCFLEGLGDDGINVHSNYLAIENIVGNNITFGIRNIPKAGDVVVAINPITFEQLPGEMEVITDDTPNKIITVDAILQNLDNSYVIYNKSAIAELTIDNVTVLKNRGRGFLIQTHNATISNCKFDQCSEAGMYITAETGGLFMEAVAPQNILVEDCTFEDCGHAEYPIIEAPLKIFAKNSMGTYAPAGTIDDITIRNNEFLSSNQDADIYITSSSNVFIDCNTFNTNVTQQVNYADSDHNNENSSIYINHTTVSMSGLPAFTSSSSPISLSGSPSGGTFSGPGIIFNAFNPSIAGAGTHTIKYTYNDDNGCTYEVSETILVFTITYNFVNYNLGTINPRLDGSTFALECGVTGGEMIVEMTFNEPYDVVVKLIKESTGQQIFLSAKSVLSLGSGYPKKQYKASNLQAGKYVLSIEHNGKVSEESFEIVDVTDSKIILESSKFNSTAFNAKVEDTDICINDICVTSGEIGEINLGDFYNLAANLKDSYELSLSLINAKNTTINTTSFTNEGTNLDLFSNLAVGQYTLNVSLIQKGGFFMKILQTITKNIVISNKCLPIFGGHRNGVGEELEVFSNPVVDFVNINSSLNGKFIIYNAQGKAMEKFDLSELENEKRIDLSDWSTGSYFIQHKESNTIKKIIKL